jgi:hypothetical protein
VNRPAGAPTETQPLSRTSFCRLLVYILLPCKPDRDRPVIAQYMHLLPRKRKRPAGSGEFSRSVYCEFFFDQLDCLCPLFHNVCSAPCPYVIAKRRYRPSIISPVLSHLHAILPETPQGRFSSRN